MKDNMDILLKKAFPADMEADAEVNATILAKAGQTHKKTKKTGFTLAGAAAIILAVLCVTPVGIYATNLIIDKVFVTEHTISVGNPDYVDDEALYNHSEEVETEDLGYEEGDESVNWLTKRVEVVNGYATNTYYTYEDYATALMDAKLDNWFNKTYENADSVTYVITETPDTVTYDVTVWYPYSNGTFHFSESVMTGNIADDMAYSLSLRNTGNKRNYVSPISGIEFSLVDEVTEDEEGDRVRTYVVIAYGKYHGYICFENLTEEEIHEILDTVVIPTDEGETVTEPSTERDEIITGQPAESEGIVTDPPAEEETDAEPLSEEGDAVEEDIVEEE